MPKYLIVIVLASALWLAPDLSHAIPILSVGSATVNVNDIFTIPVSIAAAVGLTSFQFDLSFTASILKVTATGVTESAFFTQGDIAVFNPGIVDNTSGHILGVSDALIFQSPVNGSGVLANIEFQALAPGVSPLTLSNVFLNLSDQSFEIANGQVTVNGPQPAVPEPGTVVLLTTGLVVLTWQRWTRTREPYPGPDSAERKVC
jgi:hypothetical protein